MSTIIFPAIWASEIYELKSLGSISAWRLTFVLWMIKCEVGFGCDIGNIQNFFAKKAWVVNLEGMVRLERLEALYWRHHGSLSVVSDLPLELT